ncbi:MAG: DUF975 family protein [Acholeplasmataceae bacterium]|nr:DUF975 family protein [Acholeplasmataceae bacterium]
MKQERYLYKQHAKENLIGKYGTVIPTLLIIGFINSGLSTLVLNNRPKYDPETLQLISAGNPSLVFLFSIIEFIIAAIFIFGTTKMFIETSSNQQPVLEDILLIGFKHNPVRTIVLHFLINLFVFLWLLLLIIPGIIKLYAYSMSFYLLFRKPELSATEAIDESKTLTEGYKLELFVLDLSYFGWYFIGLFTLGILWLWVYPKHMTTRTLFFNEIYEEKYPTQIFIEEEE